MKRLCFVGCGKMGSAFIYGWSDATFIAHIDVIDPHFNIDREYKFSIDLFREISMYNPSYIPDIIILGVKPHSIPAILPSLASKYKDNSLFISMASGLTLSYYTTLLGNDAPMVRLMPNLPIACKKGYIAGSYKNLTPSELQWLNNALNHLGLLKWIDEDKLNVIASVTGSGPAYYFYFTQCLQKELISRGIPKDTAEQMAKTLLIGSAYYSEYYHNKSLDQLINEVAVRGGSTQQALDIFSQELPDLVQTSLQAAIDKAIQHGQSK